MKKNVSLQVSNADEKISVILKNFLHEFHKPTATISDLRDAISSRSYGILMFILALPCVVPIPTPGLSAIVSAPLILVTFQLVIGLKTPWFPKFIAERKFKVSSLKSTSNSTLPYLEKIENVLKPRITMLVDHPADRVIALVCLALSIMIMLPIPLGNALPAFAICCFSIALLMRDGLLALFGLFMTALSLLVVFALVGTLVSTLQDITDYLF